MKAIRLRRIIGVAESEAGLLRRLTDVNQERVRAEVTALVEHLLSCLPESERRVASPGP